MLAFRFSFVQILYRISGIPSMTINYRHSSSFPQPPRSLPKYFLWYQSGLTETIYLLEHWQLLFPSKGLFLLAVEGGLYSIACFKNGYLVISEHLSLLPLRCHPQVYWHLLHGSCGDIPRGLGKSLVFSASGVVTLIWSFDGGQWWALFETKRDAETIQQEPLASS